MTWEIVGNKIVDEKGNFHDLHPDMYWYAAPSRSKYSIGERNVSWQSFGFCLHNASVGEGLVIALDDLLVGVKPSTVARSLRKIAEETLEKVRREKFPNQPSRYRCFYLNSRRDIAAQRLQMEFSGQERLVTSCYLIRDSGRFHFGDVRIYDTLVGQPEDTSLAAKYWATSYMPAKDSDHKNLEILADSALYFPEWRTFTKIDPVTSVNWKRDNAEPSQVF